ncbi:hypothetical protein PSCICF_49230 [Pseudomonas cichorii]|nr:hypothetical protein PSCICF_49230 [Pseudomonas cichorii]GFM62690.1 hypothetical protein PSCICG_38500 [Pseudomonas cichorii]
MQQLIGTGLCVLRLYPHKNQKPLIHSTYNFSSNFHTRTSHALQQAFHI